MFDLGEPYGHAWMIDSLADVFRRITDNWPEAHFFHDGRQLNELQYRFVANPYPSLQDLIDARVSFFTELFLRSATRQGAERWGIKEVRWTTAHASYLRMLFPKAKFVFLIRNPYDAYRSYAARRDMGWRWYNRWPDRPLTAREFGSHWRELAREFVKFASGPDIDGYLLRYEQLIDGDIGPLETYLGFSVDRGVLQINPADGGPAPVTALDSEDNAPLIAEVDDVCEEIGYPRIDSATATWRVDQDAKRCVILVPVGGEVVPACDQALRQLERRGYEVRRARGYAAIDQGRNQMATDALADGFDETMWIDADIGFDPDDVERLRGHGLPIVCGIYPKKGKRALACHEMRSHCMVATITSSTGSQILISRTPELREANCVRSGCFRSVQ